MKALSIRQPWAWAIIRKGKDIENRNWTTKYRGEFLVHAAKTIDKDAPPGLLKEYGRAGIVGDDCTRGGGIIGKVTLTKVVTEFDEESHSDWFQGPFGFYLENPEALPFKEVKGKLSFFEVEL